MMTTEATHEPNAAGASPHVIIRASAGTGKTHRLSSRFLKLLFDGHAVDRILATTFTRKAAGEILERVIKRLADSTVDVGTRSLLGSEVGDAELSIERCRVLLAELTRALNRIRVSTLDSFFGNLARTFGLELGLPPGWEILDQHDDFRLRRVALERMLAENQSNEISELLHLLNKGEAKRSINRMLLDTINDAYELYQETLPDGGTAWHTIPQMPMLNDTQMAPLIAELRSLSIGNSRVREAHEKAVERVENEDWDNYLKTGLAPKILNDEAKYSSWKITPEVRAAYQAVTRQAVAVKLDQLTKQTEGAYRLARSFDEKYDQLKLENEAILFSDVPVKLRQVGGNTGNRRIAYRMGSSTDHLLLDEFQDTSGTQWNAISPFARAITECMDSTKSFFCVGDTKQAIYGWRGGQAIILDSMSEQLENVSIESLNLSRRSSPEVIDTVNQVFSKMHRHDGLDQYETPIRTWCDAFPTHETAKQDMPGYACMYVADEAAEHEDQSEKTLEFTATAVKQILAESPGRSVGVLVRKNDTVGKLIHYLGALKIAASEEGGNPLTDSAAVNQILSLFRLADHPTDDVAIFHIQQGPLADALKIKSDEKGFANAASVSLKIRKQLMHDGYGPCVQRWAEFLRPLCSDRELRRLGQFVELAYGYQKRATLRADDFVRYVETTKVDDPFSADVRVMTIHQSKGLEFDVVVLTALEGLIAKPPKFVVQRDSKTFRPKLICRYISQTIQQALPAEVRKAFDDDLQLTTNEYLCGLYVALTRARRALHLIVAPEAEKSSSSNRQKTLGKNTAGLLRAALTDGTRPQPGTVLYEHGNPHWAHAENEVAAKSATPSRSNSNQALRLDIPVSETSMRGKEALSPSVSATGKFFNAKRMFSLDNQKAMEFGTLVHRWMQLIQWLDEPPTFELLQQAAVSVGTLIEEKGREVAEFHEMLTRTSIRNLLQEESYKASVLDWLQESISASPKHLRLRVLNEQPVTFETNGAIRTGTIDRLVLIYENETLVAADVIDYKTDPTTKSNLKERCEHYQPQLDAYRMAVQSLMDLPTEAVRTQLAFLTAGIVSEVKPGTVVRLDKDSGSAPQPKISKLPETQRKSSS